jgi:hypothetical protein
MNPINLSDAQYTEQILPEYMNNPFIEALPPIWSTNQVISSLAHDPGWHEGEREMAVEYRFHAVWRLFRYFQPLDIHIDIEQRISRAIRQGYISKNPLSPVYVEQLARGSKMIRNRSHDFQKYYIGNASAFGFTIIGISGIGKTTGLERILSLYPQAIQHTKYKDAPLCFTQLTWLKIDCPYDGSLKGLCLNFFSAVDRVLGSDYMMKYMRGSNTVDSLLQRMAHIATLHGLGILVIDEIQHLSLAKGGGSDKMLNFFVTLVNTIGVPVVLIGTPKALPILQGDFRQARRGTGQGDMIWERMENNAFWNILIESMWKNQWTREQIPLTDEIRDIIYDESQGIIDIAVKLYAIVQIKAIATGAETFDAAGIREAASEKLRIVKPMLDALRSGDKKKLAQYEDIRPISIDDYISVYASRFATDFTPQSKTEKLSLEEQGFLKLLEMDIPSSVAKNAVKKVLQGMQTGQPLSELVRKAFKIALNMEEKTMLKKDEGSSTGDLHDTIESNTYDNLKAVGDIADKDEF